MAWIRSWLETGTSGAMVGAALTTVVPRVVDQSCGDVLEARRIDDRTAAVDATNRDTDSGAGIVIVQLSTSSGEPQTRSRWRR